MADNQLQVILDDQGVAQENARQLIVAFGAPFEEAGAILADYRTIEVTQEDQFDLMAEARSKRLALKEIRVGVEKKRKELKEDSLRTGRAIDSVAKFVKETIEPAESYLELQEKFAEIKQAERAAAVKSERIAKLSQYTSDLSIYNLDSLDQAQFDSLLATLKTQKEAAEAAAKKAEAERLAAIETEKKHQAEVEAENTRLKAEADKREKQVATERAKLQAEADKKLAAERAVAESERQKREALEAEQRERESAEAKAKVAAEETQRQALLAPDKEKLLALASIVDSIELPALASKDAQAVLDNVEDLLAKVSNYIRGNVKGL